MSFALVFYTQSRTKDVVPTSTIPTEAQCGDVTRVRCNGRSYKAKVLHIGAKELCELKAGSVTSDGNLVEDEFDITSPLEDDDGDGSSEAGPSHAEKELVTRAIKIEDMTAVAIEKIKALDSKAAALDQRMDRMEQMMRELLRRVPPTQTQGEIVYSYASAKSVAELRQLKGLNMSHFVLALEMEVYQDDTSKLELLVDSRIRTKDRVLFIQQCLYKYYEIPAYLREGTWRKAKESLNGRVRRLRKTLRDQELTRSRNQSRHHESQERRPMQQRENNYRLNQESYYFDDE